MIESPDGNRSFDIFLSSSFCLYRSVLCRPSYTENMILKSIPFHAGFMFPRGETKSGNQIAASIVNSDETPNDREVFRNEKKSRSISAGPGNPDGRADTGLCGKRYGEIRLVP